VFWQLDHICEGGWFAGNTLEWYIPVAAVFRFVSKAECVMEVQYHSTAVTLFLQRELPGSRLYSDTGRNTQECDMEGCFWVKVIRFATSRTVLFNSCVLASQLALVCIAAEVSVLSAVIPVTVDK